jgi:hypothetical protein
MDIYIVLDSVCHVGQGYRRDGNQWARNMAQANHPPSTFW